jgi:hypothetical protein
MRPPLVIRPSPVVRLSVLVFMLVWCGILIAAAVQSAESAGFIMLALAMLLLGIGFGCRILGIAAIARGDELLVRNAFQTRRLRRSQIEEFRLGTAMPFRRTILALLSDETVALEVGLALFGPGVLEERLEQLRSWRAAALCGPPKA